MGEPLQRGLRMSGPRRGAAIGRTELHADGQVDFILHRTVGPRPR